MNLKLIFLAFLLPLCAFGATNSMDNVKVNTSLKLGYGTAATDKVVTATSSGGILKFSKVTLTDPATGCTITLTDGKTLAVQNSLTFSGTDGSTVAFGAGGTVVYGGANSTITSLSGLTTPLSVDQGGTGAATLGANLILLGNGTGAVQTIANGTTNQVLTANGAGLNPSFKTAAAGGGGDVYLGSNNVFTAGTTQTMPKLIAGTATTIVGQPNAAPLTAYATGMGAGTNFVNFLTTSVAATAPGVYIGGTNYNTSGGWMINEYSAGRGSIQFLGSFGVMRDSNGLVQYFMTASGGNLWDNGTSVGVIGDSTSSATANTLKLYNAVSIEANNKAFVVKSSSTTIGTNGTSFVFIKAATGSLSYTGGAVGTTEDQTITVTGATAGSTVLLGLPATVPTDSVFTGFVSAAGTVTIRRTTTLAAGSAAYGPATFTARVIQ